MTDPIDRALDRMEEGVGMTRVQRRDFRPILADLAAEIRAEGFKAGEASAEKARHAMMLHATRMSDRLAAVVEWAEESLSEEALIELTDIARGEGGEQDAEVHVPKCDSPDPAAPDPIDRALDRLNDWRWNTATLTLDDARPILTDLAADSREPLQDKIERKEREIEVLEGMVRVREARLAAVVEHCEQIYHDHYRKQGTDNLALARGTLDEIVRDAHVELMRHFSGQYALIQRVIRAACIRARETDPRLAAVVESADNLMALWDMGDLTHHDLGEHRALARGEGGAYAD